MKKHDEGYALALVLVVLTVICIVALSMMSVSLRNVTRQQMTLKHMEEKYAAQGEIEKVVARLEKELYNTEVTDIIPISNTSVVNACSGTNVVLDGELTFEGDKLTFTLKTNIPDSHTQITCTIRITGKKIIVPEGNEDNIYYDVKIPALEYDKYSIEYISGGGGGT